MPSLWGRVAAGAGVQDAKPARPSSAPPSRAAARQADARRPRHIAGLAWQAADNHTIAALGCAVGTDAANATASIFNKHADLSSDPHAVWGRRPAATVFAELRALGTSKGTRPDTAVFALADAAAEEHARRRRREGCVELADVCAVTHRTPALKRNLSLYRLRRGRALVGDADPPVRFVRFTVTSRKGSSGFETSGVVQVGALEVFGREGSRLAWRTAPLETGHQAAALRMRVREAAKTFGGVNVGGLDAIVAAAKQRHAATENWRLALENERWRGQVGVSVTLELRDVSRIRSYRVRSASLPLTDDPTSWTIETRDDEQSSWIERHRTVPTSDAVPEERWQWSAERLLWTLPQRRAAGVEQEEIPVRAAAEHEALLFLTTRAEATLRPMIWGQWLEFWQARLRSLCMHGREDLCRDWLLGAVRLQGPHADVVLSHVAAGLPDALAAGASVDAHGSGMSLSLRPAARLCVIAACSSGLGSARVGSDLLRYAVSSACGETRACVQSAVGRHRRGRGQGMSVKAKLAEVLAEATPARVRECCATILDAYRDRYDHGVDVYSELAANYQCTRARVCAVAEMMFTSHRVAALAASTAGTSAPPAYTLILHLYTCESEDLRLLLGLCKGPTPLYEAVTEALLAAVMGEPGASCKVRRWAGCIAYLLSTAAQDRRMWRRRAVACRVRPRRVSVPVGADVCLPPLSAATANTESPAAPTSPRVRVAGVRSAVEVRHLSAYPEDNELLLPPFLLCQVLSSAETGAGLRTLGCLGEGLPLWGDAAEQRRWAVWVREEVPRAAARAGAADSALLASAAVLRQHRCFAAAESTLASASTMAAERLSDAARTILDEAAGRLSICNLAIAGIDGVVSPPAERGAVRLKLERLRRHWEAAASALPSSGLPYGLLGSQAEEVFGAAVAELAADAVAVSDRSAQATLRGHEAERA